MALLGNETILARVLRAHTDAGLSPCIVSDAPGKYVEFGTAVLVDQFPGVGPLGGLHAALDHVARLGGEGVCVTGCDLPFLEAGMLRAILDHRNGYDAIVVVYERAPARRPLIGWFSATALPVVTEAIAHRDLAYHRLLERLPNNLALRASEMPLRHAPEIALSNVNTREDLNIALDYVHRHPDREA